MTTDILTKTVRVLGELCRYGWERILKEIPNADNNRFSQIVCHACIAHWDTSRGGITDLVQDFHDAPPSHLTAAEVVSLKLHGNLDTEIPIEEGGLLTTSANSMTQVLVRNIAELDVEEVFRWATVYFWGHPGLCAGHPSRFRESWRDFFVTNPSKDTLSVLDICVLQGCFATMNASTKPLQEIIERFASCGLPQEDEEESNPMLYN